MKTRTRARQLQQHNYINCKYYKSNKRQQQQQQQQFCNYCNYRMTLSPKNGLQELKTKQTKKREKGIRIQQQQQQQFITRFQCTFTNILSHHLLSGYVCFSFLFFSITHCTRTTLIYDDVIKLVTYERN